MTGMMIAFGLSVPELIVLKISFEEHGGLATEFAMALIFGGVCFGLAMIPAIAYFFVFGCRQKRPAQLQDPLSQQWNMWFFATISRDLGFVLISLVFYYIAMDYGQLSGVLNLAWIIAQLGVFAAYLITATVLDKFLMAKINKFILENPDCIE